MASSDDQIRVFSLAHLVIYAKDENCNNAVVIRFYGRLLRVAVKKKTRFVLIF